MYDDRLLAHAATIHAAEGGSYARIYPLFPEMKEASVRRLLHDYRKRAGRVFDDVDLRLPAPAPSITSVPDDDIDEEEVWARAVALSRRRLDRAGQIGRLTFNYGPIALVFMADLHLGSDGTDYERIEREIDIIDNTPGMYAVGVGDWLDNFIVGKLTMIRIDGTPFRVSEEWALVRHALRRLAPKLVASVAGNHDNWTHAVAGIDYLREVHQEIVGRHILYGHDELCFEVLVGDALFPIKARHKWRGNSALNPTQGIERDAKMDGSYFFKVGVGAHTHASGVAREFNNRGQTALACLCGAYKREDDYAIASGFPRPNDGTAVAVILNDDGTMFGTSSLAAAADYMRVMWGER